MSVTLLFVHFECRFTMAGYHANDAANEEATWVHPSGERCLRTGDIGKQQRIAATVLIAELPRNPNGKILKRELRKQYADALGQAKKGDGT